MEIKGLGSIVTGGASGLGEATARMLAARGAQVALLDLPRSRGVEVAQEIGGHALFFAADVTNEDEVDAAVEGAVDAFGALHVLVNCAGIGSASRTVGRRSPSTRAPIDARGFSQRSREPSCASGFIPRGRTRR